MSCLHDEMHGSSVGLGWRREVSCTSKVSETSKSAGGEYLSGILVRESPVSCNLRLLDRARRSALPMEQDDV